MEIKGTIIQVMPVQSGTSAAGKDWAKQDFVLETPGQYPKKICFTLWGEQKINDYDLQPNLEVTVYFNLESREYNGRWYTEAKSDKISWTKEARQWNAQQEKKGQAATEDDDLWSKPSKVPEKKEVPTNDSFDELPF